MSFLLKLTFMILVLLYGNTSIINSLAHDQSATIKDKYPHEKYTAIDLLYANQYIYLCTTHIKRKNQQP